MSSSHSGLEASSCRKAKHHVLCKIHLQKRKRKDVKYATMLGRDVTRKLCTSRAGTKRPRGTKSPSKKPPKAKSHFSESTEEINSTLRSLQRSLSSTTPQLPQLGNPHASLWERLEAMTITTDDKITVGEFLARHENKGSV